MKITQDGYWARSRTWRDFEFLFAIPKYEQSSSITLPWNMLGSRCEEYVYVYSSDIKKGNDSLFVNDITNS